MKRLGRSATVWFSLLTSGFLLAGPAGHGIDPRPAVQPSVAAATPRDPLATAAGRRWLQGQPRHWRAFMLQR